MKFLSVLLTIVMSFTLMVATALPAQAHVTRCIPNPAAEMPAKPPKLTGKVVFGQGGFVCYGGNTHHDYVSLKVTLQVKKRIWYNYPPSARIESKKNKASTFVTKNCFKGTNTYRVVTEVVTFGAHGTRYRKSESPARKFKC